MTRCVSSLLALLPVVVVAAVAPAQTTAESAIQGFLAQEIIGPDLALTEVQWYCGERVPDLPDVQSRSDWEAMAERWRSEVLEKIVYRGAARQWRDAPLRVEWQETMDAGPGYRIRKLRYEALPGLWIPALLYEPEQLSGKVAAVLNVNGHTALGKQYPPKQIRCINQAKRGMLALNIEWIGMGQLAGAGFTHYRMNQLDLCGTSGLAPFYLNMKRGLDVLLSLPHADPERVAVTGLSGGGWQTIFLSALDTRVRLSNPVAGYSSFRTRVWHLKDLGDSEQTPNDLATICDYTHLTAMLAPRPALLTFNLHDDCCFEGAYALDPLLQAARPIFRLYEKEPALRSHINNDPPAKHNFDQDNRQQLYRMLGDFFFPDDKTYDSQEIPSDEEIQTEESLRVTLPEGNRDFQQLALELSQDLPRDADLPAEAPQAWQQPRHGLLRELVRAKDYLAQAEQVAQDEKEGIRATFWRMSLGNVWTVPVVELERGTPRQTVVVVADDGRQSLTARITELLQSDTRVLAVDPFYLGESKISQRDFLFALLVAAVGDRPLGLQASQVAAIARWATSQRDAGPVTLMAFGPRCTAMALIAATLEEKAIGEVVLHDSLGSLQEVIERNWAVNEKPELFCFGLFESFDIRQLVALVAPRPVRFVHPSDRARQELSDLGAWYRHWQRDFDPLAP